MRDRHHDRKNKRPGGEPGGGKRVGRSAGKDGSFGAGKRGERSGSKGGAFSAGKRDERSASKGGAFSAGKRDERSVSKGGEFSAGKRDERSASKGGEFSASKRGERSADKGAERSGPKGGEAGGKRESGRPWWLDRERDRNRGERAAPRDEDHDDAGGGEGTAPGEQVLLFGIHPVEAALGNPKRSIGRLHLTDNALRRLKTQVENRGITPLEIAPRDLDRRLGADTVHQGALLETQALVEPTLEELAELAEHRPLVVLDQVTDPHNVGAILRSAAVFGAAGVVMTRRHSPPLDGTLAKSASGALEHVPIALVSNLARSIEELKELGFMVIGLDGEAKGDLTGIDWAQRVALVLGAEGKGLRQLTRDRCDQLCRIDTEGPIASLNVSNAAAVALHFASFRRRTAKA